MRRILCGIVTFNPEIKRFEKNISTVTSQVDEIIIVDNASTNIDDIRAVVNNKAALICNDSNVGIAAALNQIVSYAFNNEYHYVLFLDQDTVVPNNLIIEYINGISLYPNAIICPKVQYKNGPQSALDGHHFANIDWCITSGSFLSIDLLKRIGKFDEKMFIDLVDLDYCIRAKRNGALIIQDNHVIIDHELGNLKYIQIGKHILWIENHNAFRKYYIIRNRIYVQRKYKISKRQIAIDILLEYIKVILFENDKLNKIRRMNKGIHDGKRMLLG